MQSDIMTSNDSEIKARENSMRTNIEFYMSHLSIKELTVLEKTAFALANNYSDSYIKWLQSK